MYGYFSFKEFSQAFTHPGGPGAGLARMEMVYLSKKIDQSMAENPQYNAMDHAGAAILKTAMTVGVGVIDSPEAIVNQTGEWLKDTGDVDKFPVLGQVGKKGAYNVSKFIDERNFENFIQVWGSLGEGFLLVAPFLPKGAKIAPTEAGLKPPPLEPALASQRAALLEEAAILEDVLWSAENASREAAITAESTVGETTAVLKPVPEVASERLPQDIKVNPNAPNPLPTDRPIGKSPTQNAAAQAKIKEFEEAGYTDIRVNQQQVNAAGERVGINRPDIQATSPSGQRVYIEYDTSVSNRGPLHEQRIKANDPTGKVELYEGVD